MPININGFALAYSSGLALGPSGTMINSYGVREPPLPGMMGAATGGGGYQVYPFPVNDVTLNNGSPWSTSNYRFTCPVAGIYYTSFGGIVGPNAGSAYVTLMINGATWYYGHKNNDHTWELEHVELMVRLAAGDTIAWSMNASPGPVGTGGLGAYQSNHNNCTIWKVA